jgi:small subunit ribosomal protein S11
MAEEMQPSEQSISTTTANQVSTQADNDESEGGSSSVGGTGTAAAKSASKSRKKRKREVSDGIAHITASFNNTIVTITDQNGNTLSWSTAAGCGFRGSRKSTPFAAQQASAKAAATAINDYGLRCVEVRVRNAGPGRDAGIRALYEAGLRIKAIVDITPIPFNGCRPSKKRRV